MTKTSKYTPMEPQVDALCEKLDRELDNFPEGARFYSLRQLQIKYKYHRGIIDRALEELEARRQIRCVPRVGIFSSVTRKQLAYKVHFLNPDWPSNMIQEWSAAAAAYVAERPQWVWQERFIDPELPLAVSCAPKDADAMILFCPSCGISREDMLWLASLKTPLVLLNGDTGSFELSCVLSDDRAGAAQVADYLAACGHRRIAIVYSEPHTVISEERINSLLIAAKLLKLETVMIDCRTVSGEYSPHKAYSAMKEYLKEHDSRADFTTVYSITGDCVPGIMTALRESGYELPQDISIISMTTEGVGRFNHPPLTAVCNDLDAEVRMTFEGLEELLTRKRTFFKAVAPMRLIERASVRNLASTNKEKSHETESVYTH